MEPSNVSFSCSQPPSSVIPFVFRFYFTLLLSMLTSGLNVYMKAVKGEKKFNGADTSIELRGGPVEVGIGPRESHSKHNGT